MTHEMTLEEEEKKLVLNFLGYDVIPLDGTNIGHLRYGYTDKNANWILLSEYLANEEREWWDEILDKMSKQEKIWFQFLLNLEPLIDAQAEGHYKTAWLFLTAKPEPCWKALIKTLEP